MQHLKLNFTWKVLLFQEYFSSITIFPNNCVQLIEILHLNNIFTNYFMLLKEKLKLLYVSIINEN